MNPETNWKDNAVAFGRHLPCCSTVPPWNGFFPRACKLFVVLFEVLPKSTRLGPDNPTHLPAEMRERNEREAPEPPILCNGMVDEMRQKGLVKRGKVGRQRLAMMQPAPSDAAAIYFLQDFQLRWICWVKATVASSSVSTPVASLSALVRAIRLLMLRMPLAPHGEKM